LHHGTAETLRTYNPGLQAIAVEPAESPVLSGGRSGAHKIDGVGAGFVVPLWRADLPDRVEQVSTEDSRAMGS
jgi:cysteine synthase A